VSRVDVRSDNAVDHYRPKSRVAECPKHPGYWWLAFDWTNYRFSCTFCNSLRRDDQTESLGGKKDRFPLRDESRRAFGPDDTLDDEEPVLLDPTWFGDPPILWFDEDGRATENPSVASEGSFPHARATVSIEAYPSEPFSLS
jgi:hypothetical protein